MQKMIKSDDHIQGPENARIELIEYGDYQCPYCREAYFRIKEVQKQFGNDLRFAFRNFPITSMHQFSLHAALAAEAAGAQDKFWEMHDKLYENQEYLEDTFLLEYAGELGLDTDRFKKDFSDQRYYQKIKDDYESGIKMGINGTPGFFLNGRLYAGDWTGEEFIRDLEAYIK